ncbi:syntaxin-binding protein 5 isoform X9 [Drosophila miranda]|uniref:syntaxin-binding protein 5 isoform X9 n=1 Tax=Drosophila miranda TaxID=7229 RepID=UPI00143F9D44|nr:syntaxin-binding protein 5 isoform X9 [Drosophila miranda]
MKKFTFKGVLDGFRQSVQPQATRQEQEIQEQLKADHFTLKKTFRHGFPYSPTSFAFDPVQKLIAIGDKSGYIRILGKPGVDAHAKHEGESECAVLFAQFLVNEGALVTVTADDTIHLWSIRQKTPRIVQSLKFQRERVTCIHLPVGSKWLYVGTEKGNIHVVHIDTFALSGYIINWNKAIEVVRTSHPGAVIALCDNPLDANKLLIAFECGLLVLWDLKAKCAEIRWQAAEAVKSLAWHYEGKYFVSSHTDGSICSWPTRPQPKPQSQVCPHAKINKDGNAEKCKPIYKVDLKSSTTGETFTIFSGGMPSEKGSKSNCITVMVGKATTVLEMEHAVCDFITLCENPWPCETQEPYAIAVLLQYDLVLIDLLTPGFPCFESPYPMDLHESPVTCCTYLTDCPSDLVPAFYSVGRTTTSKKSCFSEREWPISGGEWSPASCSYSEIVITGHQDGSLKFWDSGAGTLQILYKLKTAKMFEKPRTHAAQAHADADNPLAVHLIFLCSESRRLCVAGAMGQVMLFKFRKVESTSEVLVLEIPILYENFDDIYGTSPECDFLTGHQVQKTESSDSDKTTDCSLKVRFGAQRKPPGFQSQLVCLTTGPNRRNVQVTSLCISSSYGLMAYGTEYGLVIIDIIQKICLLSVACPDLYGAHDPYSRTPKSPKRIENKEEQSRSPSSDQINGGAGNAANASAAANASQQQQLQQQQQQQQPLQQTIGGGGGSDPSLLSSSPGAATTAAASSSASSSSTAAAAAAAAAAASASAAAAAAAGSVYGADDAGAGVASVGVGVGVGGIGSGSGSGSAKAGAGAGGVGGVGVVGVVGVVEHHQQQQQQMQQILVQQQQSSLSSTLAAMQSFDVDSFDCGAGGGGGGAGAGAHQHQYQHPHPHQHQTSVIQQQQSVTSYESLKKSKSQGGSTTEHSVYKLQQTATKLPLTEHSFVGSKRLTANSKTTVNSQNHMNNNKQQLQQTAILQQQMHQQITETTCVLSLSLSYTDTHTYV